MSMILDGSNGVTFNDSSLQGAAASPYGLKNRIINGDMRIDQRNAGASVTIPATSVTYTVDRWFSYASQASKFTVQQNAGSVTPPAGFTNYLGCTSSSAYSVVASDLFVVSQRVEGLNVADLAWGTANAATVTLSFWVRSSLTGTFGGSLKNSAGDRSYPFSYTISAANTWEKKSITIAGDTSGTWLTTNGIGIDLNFGLGNGSTFSGTAGSWQAANLVSATGAVSVVGTNGATFYITGVQLEIGTSATPFERRLYGTELALCQRYYQKYTSIAAGDGICFGGYGFPQSSSIFRLPGSFPTPFRGTPTFSYSNLSVSTAGGTQSTVSSSAGMSANSTGYDLNLNVTVTTGTPYFLRATSGNNGYVDFSAEL
jgi:hypothetical protein